MIPDFPQFDTPVLLIAFNRPDLARQTLKAIAAVRPRRLYFAVDGPRPDQTGEAEKCEKTRELVSLIDWDCQLHTLFRERNVGMKMGMSGAINWLFENEPEGIIVEDDCVADPSFFYFCQELLERYRDDPRVGLIAGNNHDALTMTGPESYRFSIVPLIWGWATWRRAWQCFDVTFERYKDRLPVLQEKLSNTPGFARFLTMQLINAPQAKYWSRQFVGALALNDMLSVWPKQNLVKNVGFGEEATHTFDLGRRPVSTNMEQLAFPLAHPACVEVDALRDRKYDKAQFPNSLPRRIARALKITKLVKYLRHVLK